MAAAALTVIAVLVATAVFLLDQGVAGAVALRAAEFFSCSLGTIGGSGDLNQSESVWDRAVHLRDRGDLAGSDGDRGAGRHLGGPLHHQPVTSGTSPTAVVVGRPARGDPKRGLRLLGVVRADPRTGADRSRIDASVSGIPVVGWLFPGPIFRIFRVRGRRGPRRSWCCPSSPRFVGKSSTPHRSPRRKPALAFGATKWEMLRLAVLPRSRSGIFGAAILGLGRAFGETIAVTHADRQQRVDRPARDYARGIHHAQRHRQ